MGKGDQRTKKGKRVSGTYGKSRLRKPEKAKAEAAAKVAEAQKEV